MGKGDDLSMCSPHFPPLLFLALATQSLQAHVDNLLLPTVHYSFHSSHNHWSSSSVGFAKDICKIGSDLYVRDENLKIKCLPAQRCLEMLPKYPCALTQMFNYLIPWTFRHPDKVSSLLEWFIFFQLSSLTIKCLRNYSHFVVLPMGSFEVIVLLDSIKKTISPFSQLHYEVDINLKRKQIESMSSLLLINHSTSDPQSQSYIFIFLD